MSQAAQSFDLSYTQNRELSWLKFNQRVLEEAADPSTPLMERFRFLSIFSSNLDEFFRVRVGSLLDLSLEAPICRENKGGLTPVEQLTRIYTEVGPLIAQRDIIYTQLQALLAECGVEDVPYEQLKGQERAYVRAYYHDKIRPLLVPQVINPSHPFPHLKNKALYAAARLRDGERVRLGLVGIPEGVPRILPLPERQGAFVRTENILAHYLKKIFKIYRIEEQAIIAVTRNADISYDEKYDEEDMDLRSQMTKLLRERERLAPVRLEMQGGAPNLRDMLLQRLRLQRHQSYTCTCPLDLSYAYDLEKVPPVLFYPPHQPVYPAWLTREQPMWEQVRQRDILLFYPYHSMDPFLQLLQQAAVDPAVRAIQITLYRVARKSAVAKYLCMAAEHGKAVTVLVELRARFDEGNNIAWAKELEEAGCHILYGPENYKCHAKLCLITRQSRDRLQYVAQVGTGNYNEKTARLYTDFCLMTADPEICMDVVAFFQNMLVGDLRGRYDALLVAPASLKQTLLHQIEEQTALGERGRIIIKTNSVTEREIIDKLAEASQAGVHIDLIVRGICCLVPGIEGKTDHIRVTSIVGRFLEHSRIYCFGQDAQLYISSADIMTRNQERRVEVACPIRSPEVKAFLLDYLERILQDNVKARRLCSDGSYVPLQQESLLPCAVQQYYLDHVPMFSSTVPKKKQTKGILHFFRRIYERNDPVWTKK